MRTIALTASVVCLVAAASTAHAQVVLNGVGRAPITKDAESVRAQAEEAAKIDLVQALARQTLGAERLNELSPDLLRRLARQIRSEMIVDRSSVKVGKEFEVTLSARIEQAWFQGLLDAENIRSSVDVAGGAQTRILVMLDEVTGAARDFDKPAEIVTEYDRNSGASFSDNSVAAFSEKDRSAATFKGASAAQVRGSTAVGYSDGYGSAAGRSNGSAASAVKVQSAAATSHSVAAIDKTDVQASVHDNERYRQRVTYQTVASKGPSDFAKAGFSSGLENYRVEVSEDQTFLSTYFNGAAPEFRTLEKSALFEPFLRSTAQRGVNSFMGGSIEISQGGKDPATGQVTCSGRMSVRAFATGTSEVIGSGASSAKARGDNSDECAANLSIALAEQVSAIVGPKVQNHWRGKSRDQARVVASAVGPVEYTLSVRGANLSMAAQADLLDALSATPGVQNSVFLGQSGNQISFQVRYSGNLPLQMALYQKLRSNPAFAQMKASTEGQSVTLCLTAC